MDAKILPEKESFLYPYEDAILDHLMFSVTSTGFPDDWLRTGLLLSQALVLRVSWVFS